MREELFRKKHEETIWTSFANLFLGLWLLTGHIAFGYTSSKMIYSDVASGILVIIFSLFSLSYRKTWAPWMVCLVGVWLQCAPLVFWAPDSASYCLDTLIGAFLIVFSLLVPGIPGKLSVKGPRTPLGWSYNPSSWIQRIPIIFLGVVGWFIARYLAAFQLGYIDSIWDPFFGDGTLHVITSKVSKAFPVSDAGLGAFAYTMEALMGCKGDTKRWYTMPWIVVGFGILVVPLGLVSIILIILQPLIVGSWCTLCLCTAFAMLIMISLTVDEVVATLQYLSYARKKKLSFWKVFFEGGQEDFSQKEEILFSKGAIQAFSSMTKGVQLRWNLAFSILIGMAFMALPSFVPLNAQMKDVSPIFGALLVTISVISMAEVIRAARYINIGIAVAILVACSLWQRETPVFLLYAGLSMAVVFLSFPKGKIKEKYGSWNRFIK